MHIFLHHMHHQCFLTEEEETVTLFLHAHFEKAALVREYEPRGRFKHELKHSITVVTVRLH